MGCAASSEAEASHYETKQLPKQPIADGTVVRISGLESRADLNGRHGLVSGWRVESDRLIINVRGELVALRASNLAAAPDALAVGTRVRIHGLVNQPEHNGKPGAVVSFNQQSGRNRVRLTEPPHRELALKRSSLELIADDVTPALMPTGGNEGTQDANSALGSAYRTGGQPNAKHAHAPSALHRNKSEASMRVLSELSKLQQQLTALQVRAAALEAEVGGGWAADGRRTASRMGLQAGDAARRGASAARAAGRCRPHDGVALEPAEGARAEEAARAAGRSADRRAGGVEESIGCV